MIGREQQFNVLRLCDKLHTRQRQNKELLFLKVPEGRANRASCGCLPLREAYLYRVVYSTRAVSAGWLALHEVCNYSVSTSTWGVSVRRLLLHEAYLLDGYLYMRPICRVATSILGLYEGRLPLIYLQDAYLQGGYLYMRRRPICTVDTSTCGLSAGYLPLHEAYLNGGLHNA